MKNLACPWCHNDEYRKFRSDLLYRCRACGRYFNRRTGEKAHSEKDIRKEVNIDIHFEADNDVAVLRKVIRDIEEIVDNNISTDVDVEVYITDKV